MMMLRSSSRLGLPALVEAACRLPCACILLSPSSLEGKTEVEFVFSFHLARRAFEEKRNISAKASNEALLFFSREMNFASALRKNGAKDARDFVLVCEKRLPIAQVRETLGLKTAKKISLSRMGKKKGAYFEGELAVEEMALARVKN